MAQVQEKNTTKGGKRRANKMTTHLDMTPMVDLAFLLLTFFMLTTTFSKMNTMELLMPTEPEEITDHTPVNPENALTLILGENNQVYYYFGYSGDDPEITETDYSANGIRKVLISDKVKNNRKMVVLIKPMATSRYSNLVDVLDEMKITGARKYALVAIQEDDKELVNRLAEI